MLKRCRDEFIFVMPAAKSMYGWDDEMHGCITCVNEDGGKKPLI